MSWKSEPRKISVVVDNDSWIIPYAKKLVEKIEKTRDEVKYCQSYSEIENGTVVFYLGCINIVPRAVLDKNTFNLVVHESELPKGRGFAPVAWQVIEGKNDIQISLIEAAESPDTGGIYLHDEIKLEGHELNNEIRHAQGLATCDICMKFLSFDSAPYPVPQRGAATYYKRRSASDSKLNIKKSIEDQFNLLRTVDNERYPAFFEKDGHCYKLIIEKINE